MTPADRRCLWQTVALFAAILGGWMAFYLAGCAHHGWRPW